MSENLDHMRIWNAVSKTDPIHTKRVNQRGGFTAIGANYQIMMATQQFGPIGIGWGYDSGEPIFHDTLLFVPVTLWHGDRANRFGPMTGCEEWKDNKGRVDSDASKKATTDALTKLLSQLGFNADVFLGYFDDQKYVEQRMEEFHPPRNEQHAEISADEALDLETSISSAETIGQLQEAFKAAYRRAKGTEFEAPLTKAKDARKAAIETMDKLAA